MTMQGPIALNEVERAAIERITARATVRAIVRQVCAETGHSYAEITGPSHKAALCRVREGIYVRAQDQGFSLPQIGRVFRRHHTTILHGIRNAKSRKGEA